VKLYINFVLRFFTGFKQNIGRACLKADGFWSGQTQAKRHRRSRTLPHERPLRKRESGTLARLGARTYRGEIFMAKFV